jgi:hypothetical protein
MGQGLMTLTWIYVAYEGSMKNLNSDVLIMPWSTFLVHVNLKWGQRQVVVISLKESKSVYLVVLLLHVGL